MARPTEAATTEQRGRRHVPPDTQTSARSQNEATGTAGRNTTTEGREQGRGKGKAETTVSGDL